jgi:hypothetical protein
MQPDPSILLLTFSARLDAEARGAYCATRHRAARSPARGTPVTSAQDSTRARVTASTLTGYGWAAERTTISPTFTFSG